VSGRSVVLMARSLMSRRRRWRRAWQGRSLPTRKASFAAGKLDAWLPSSARRFGPWLPGCAHARHDTSQQCAAHRPTGVPRVLDTPGSGCQSGRLMLQWFRAHARSIAAASLVSLATLSVWSATPHQDDCHDASCASVVVPHDPSAHSIGRDWSEADRPLHCVLCHWTRIVRPSAGAAQHLSPSLERNVRILVDIVSSPQFFFAAQPPLRAPPSSPALDV
jgi:hypothetical protein